ncbi:MAG: plastocyanin/azurin family copper-binding protein [Nitrososphaerales archaeon]
MAMVMTNKMIRLAWIGITFLILYFVAPTVLIDSLATEEPVRVDIVAGSSNPSNAQFYVPAEARIDTGTLLLWTNLDNVSHTVSSGEPNNGDTWGLFFQSPLLKPGETFEWKFNTPGEFPYFCIPHPWMIATVIVTGEEHEVHEEVEVPEIFSQFPVVFEDHKFNVEYFGTYAEIRQIEIEPESISVRIHLASVDTAIIGAEETAHLNIKLPREMIDSEGRDFTVDVDDREPLEVEELEATETYRLFHIEFPSGSNTLEITGTKVIPEFPSIIGIMFASAIAMFILTAHKNRKLFRP